MGRGDSEESVMRFISPDVLLPLGDFSVLNNTIDGRVNVLEETCEKRMDFQMRKSTA